MENQVALTLSWGILKYRSSKRDLLLLKNKLVYNYLNNSGQYYVKFYDILIEYSRVNLWL